MYFTINEGKLRGNFTQLKNGLYTYKQIQNKRSIPANSYYWACLQIISQEYANVGIIHITEFLHNQFRCLLPKKRIKSDFSKKYVLVYKSTTELNSKEFSAYLTAIKVLCEFGQLAQIPTLEPLESFIIPEAYDKNLLNWVDDNN